jgi:hypothetical protein
MPPASQKACNSTRDRVMSQQDTTTTLIRERVVALAV